MLYLGGILVVVHIVSTLRADLYVEVQSIGNFWWGSVWGKRGSISK